MGVFGIRFKPCGKLYDFEADEIDLNPGDMVVVESEMGLSIGRVVCKSGAVSGTAEYKKVLRLASEEDVKEVMANAGVEKEAFLFCKERVMVRGLQMKLIRTESTLDRKRIIFYFIAEKRIDFRELVKDLAQKFRTRIEMRQIGVRDEAKMTGGLGLCGRELCCSSFLVDFAPISIKMAKKQELVLNTGKLSGICGRLMCCLGYEYMGQGILQGGEESAEEVNEECPDEAVPEVPVARECTPAAPHTRKKWRPEHGRQRRAHSPGTVQEAEGRMPSPGAGQSGPQAPAPQTPASQTPASQTVESLTPPLQTPAPQETASSQQAGAESAGNRRKRKRKWRKRGRHGDKNKKGEGTSAGGTGASGTGASGEQSA